MRRSSIAGHPLTMAALALALSAALAGCGTAATPEPEAAESGDQQDQSATQADIPETLAATKDIAHSIAESGDTSAADDYDELPADENEGDIDLEPTDIAVAADEEDKASPSMSVMRTSALQLTIPENWVFTNLGDLFILAPDDYSVTGVVEEIAKPDGKPIDVEAMVKAVPAKAAAQGMDVTVADCKTAYTPGGKLCSCQVLFKVTNGSESVLEYLQIVESKEHLTQVLFEGDTQAFTAHIEEISAVIGSLSFLAGQEP